MSIRNIHNAEHYTWGNNSDGWHFLKTDELSIIKERISAGEGEERHYHNAAQQYFYILSGEAYIELSDKKYKLTVGEGLHVPAKAIHLLKNTGKTDLIFLVISQPESHGDKVIT